MYQKIILVVCFVFIQLKATIYSQVNHITTRTNINLTDWKFKKGIWYNAQKKDYNTNSWGNVKVPHTYSMDAIEKTGYYKGEAWYRTSIDVPQSMKNERIFIRFEGVGQEAQVYLNEKSLGKHIGGYSAFIYEITDVVEFNKKNLIAVKVTNEPNFKRIPVDDKLFNHYGGIYRPVQIFSTPKQNISPNYYASPGIFIEQQELSSQLATLEIKIHVSSSTKNKPSTLSYKVFDRENNLIISKNQLVSFSEKEQIVSQKLEIENPILWNGKMNPYLYKLEVELNHYGKIDKVIQAFGLRTFKVDPEKGFFLNDKPYRLNGVAIHQEWKDNGPALSNEQHQKDIDLIDEMGATSIRMSHYQHSDLQYQLADKKGLLVWAEIPFVHDYSGREQGNAKQQLRELILQNYNHPSIYVWGLWNEVRAWKGKNAPPVLLTQDLNKLAHSLDKTRLTASASDRGMISNMGNISDLQAWNKYFGWYYGEYEDMGKWLDNARKEYPEIELGISEYGVGGNIYQQDVAKLEKPIGNYFPESVQTNYHEVTWKIIKDRPFVWSSYIWNMFDFSVAGWNRGGIQNLNHKGLVTFDRAIKKDAFYFYKANWNKEPMLYIAEQRNNIRTSSKTNVKIFTNINKVTLYLNGKKVRSLKQTADLNTIIFENINLTKGKNIIEVKGKIQKEIVAHKVIWELK
ncbi:beta-galactosidase [Lutibacter oricola]|uniref:Beta-galactosidase n=1 Tax=Lutibacter oricola TaxID=762486 RepID=A0A1H2ZNG3_9FLAO|nr:glycoside hydrolase family 2 TIM barrel-domain containing protein [Lutibacter oricola]SDX18384.1 beta-galactosidase [Lutibacter oricola]